MISGERFLERGGAEMVDWILILGWGSPIGIGIFLVLLATMIFVLTKADETSKRTKRYKEDEKK